MDDLVKASFSIEWELLKEFDSIIKSKGLHSRSKAIRDLVEDFVIEERLKCKSKAGIKKGVFIIITISNSPQTITTSDLSLNFPIDKEHFLFISVLINKNQKEAEKLIRDIKEKYRVDFCKLMLLK